MLPHLVFFLFLFVCSAVFALLEIQIEGADGWAAKLPAWRIKNRWTEKFLGAKPVTGYHFYCLFFILVLLHLPYALGLVLPSRFIEARILSFYILFWIFEDFICIALNPHFGIGKFSPGHIWWHSRWWGMFPREYWIFFPVGIFLYLFSCCG